jgi:hypothetical protein
MKRPAMGRSARVRAVAALLSLTTLPGCSLLFVNPPPDRPPSYADAPRRVECTSSVAAPVVDTVIAGLQIVRTGIAATADDSVYDDAKISRGADIAIGVSLMTLFGLSAVYGFYTTDACSDRQGTFTGGE